MNFPIPVLFIWSFIGIYIIRHHMRKNSKAQEEVTDAFWKKEEDSLVVRKKELTPEDYVYPQLKEADFKDQDYYQALGLPELARQAKYAKELVTKPMVNFTDTSNTDLRLTYGTAMLTVISDYEDTYNNYINTLYTMAEALIEKEALDQAVTYLEEGLQLGTDNRKHFLLLAKCYKTQNKPDSLKELKEKAASLNSLTKKALLKELETID